jgi:hypothetical protein
VLEDHGTFRSSRLALIAGVLGSCCVLVCGAATEPSKLPKTTTKATVQEQSAPVCQSPALKLVPPTQTVSGTHAITLSWNASAASPAHGKPDGYCVYRSAKRGEASLENKCKECELLNRAPLTGTTCVDNAITDGPTYFYAVAALNAGGMSGPSNETPASTQADKSASSPSKATPNCNGTSSAQPSAKATAK